MRYVAWINATWRGDSQNMDCFTRIQINLKAFAFLAIIRYNPRLNLHSNKEDLKYDSHNKKTKAQSTLSGFCQIKNISFLYKF